jgi:hypothetical protein
MYMGTCSYYNYHCGRLCCICTTASAHVLVVITTRAEEEFVINKAKTTGMVMIEVRRRQGCKFNWILRDYTLEPYYFN